MSSLETTLLVSKTFDFSKLKTEYLQCGFVKQLTGRLQPVLESITALAALGGAGKSLSAAHLLNIFQINLTSRSSRCSKYNTRGNIKIVK